MALSALFIFSLFKNIAYPLMWNDEAETAIYANRILEYGYPKIDDGKNVVYLNELPGKQIGDAYTGTTWGHFYFATIGAFFAKITDNIYTKTMLLRIPFGLIGFAGLIVMAFSAAFLFKKDTISLLLFLIIFVCFELLSTNIFLLLREVRYYSLVVFFSACIIYLYINYRFSRIVPFRHYVAFTVICLFLLYNSFSAAYFILSATILIYETAVFLKNKNIKYAILGVSPVLFSIVFVGPLLFVFSNFQIAKEIALKSNVTSALYMKHLQALTMVLARYEFLYLLFFIKFVLYITWLLYIVKRRKNVSAIKPVYIAKNVRDMRTTENGLTSVDKKIAVSHFMTLLFIVYVAAIIRIPINELYTRYFILLQPLSALIIVLDTFIFYELLSGLSVNRWKASFNHKIATIIVILAFLFCLGDKPKMIRAHWHELFNQYKGPLDFAIPYIASAYKHTEDLVIATNYEEVSYMYYLGSKVVMGFLGRNLKEDMATEPDVIILRKRWMYYSPELFKTFLNKYRYEEVRFPVIDYLVNNIPELNNGPGYVPHLFWTPITDNPDDMLVLYLRR